MPANNNTASVVDSRKDSPLDTATTNQLNASTIKSGVSFCFSFSVMDLLFQEVYGNTTTVQATGFTRQGRHTHTKDQHSKGSLGHLQVQAISGCHNFAPPRLPVRLYLEATANLRLFIMTLQESDNPITICLDINLP